jgi:hypothetical protein
MVGLAAELEGAHLERIAGRFVGHKPSWVESLSDVILLGLFALHFSALPSPETFSGYWLDSSV